MKQSFFVLFLLIQFIQCSFASEEEFDYEILLMDSQSAHFLNSKNELDGPIYDILSKAFELAGRKVKFVLTPINRCMLLVEQGKALGCSAFPVFKDNQYPGIEFHKRPLRAKSGSVFLFRLKEGHEQCSFDKLGDKKIAVLDLANYRQYEKLKKSLMIPVSSDSFALDQLLFKRADFALIHSSSIPVITKENMDKIENCGEFIQIKGFVGFNPKDPKSKSAEKDLDRGLEILRRKKLDLEIAKKWEK